MAKTPKPNLNNDISIFINSKKKIYKVLSLKS